MNGMSQDLNFMFQKIWRCGASVVMVPSNHMIAGSNRTCAAIYKMPSCKIAIS